MNKKRFDFLYQTSNTQPVPLLTLIFLVPVVVRGGSATESSIVELLFVLQGLSMVEVGLGINDNDSDGRERGGGSGRGKGDDGCGGAT